MSRSIPTFFALAALSTAACGEVTPGLPQTWAEAVEPDLPGVLEPAVGEAQPETVPSASPSVTSVLANPPAPLGGVAPTELGFETFESVTLPGRSIAKAPPAEAPIETGAPAPGPGFREGALCTFTAAQFGSACTQDPSGGACLLGDHFTELFGTEGLVIGGVKSVSFSGPESVRQALPGRSTEGTLTESRRDPSETELGSLASELAALAINVAVSDAGFGGSADLGAARLTHGIARGWAVESVLRAGERLLAGEPQPFSELGYGADEIAVVVADINRAAPGCAATGLLTR
ncbi:hypothetical protein L6V77_17645 [Myxococcota bacterium]|nr:hypothetical protein [Myxococcota bacterium]